MTIKRTLQKAFYTIFGIKDPSLKDELKHVKRSLGGFGYSHSKKPGERIYETKEHDFLHISSDNGTLIIKRLIRDYNDVPELYTPEYVGKVLSIVREYKKGTIHNPNKGVTKNTTITEFVHKSIPPKIEEFTPGKRKPYLVEIHKDDNGHNLKVSHYTSDYKGMANPYPATKQKKSDYILSPLNLF